MSTRIDLAPTFLDGPQGRLFVMRWRPHGTPRGTVLFVPPFGEEMNRARRLMAETGQRLAAAGMSGMLPDLSGTGDSPGSFAEASWTGWVAEIEHLLDRLAGSDEGPVHLVALRAGALLTAGCSAPRLAELASLSVVKPIANGASYARQLLRTRLAANLAGTRRETTAGLRAQMADGASLEIGGYPMGSGIFDSLERARLDAAPLPPDLRLRWYEIGQAPEAPGTPAGLPEAWRAQGVEVRYIADPPFWNIQDPDEGTGVRDALVADLSAGLRSSAAHGSVAA